MGEIPSIFWKLELASNKFAVSVRSLFHFSNQFPVSQCESDLLADSSNVSIAVPSDRNSDIYFDVLGSGTNRQRSRVE